MTTDMNNGHLLAPTSVLFHSLVVSDVQRLTSDSVSVEFFVPESLRKTYEFAPGQSVALRRIIQGEEHRRSYSIAEATGQGFRIGVREVTGGHFSPWLVREVRPGDAIDVFPPQGRFHIRPEDRGRHLCIAAGSGITPMLAITSSVLESNDGEVTLIYGNRSPDSIMFAGQLESLSARYPDRFSQLRTFSRQGMTQSEALLRLDASGLRRVLSGLPHVTEFDHVWICGPFEMALGAREQIVGDGVPASHVRVELFSADGAAVDASPPKDAQSPDETTVIAVLSGQSSTYVQGTDITLLQGLEAARDDAPFSCRSGVCGTCRVLVQKGSVEMRENYALDPDEVEDGYVLACQSYPLGGAIELDFDS
ncbi:2Fe-2S iron-sulfur cluster-binding protein [Paenarthrobacter sp. JL.01a]|uniref:2Fe-2S iron-sulfur cluster-binding protein n=1 Tax=Paenarthrobacter sp. JL.01a TaxID=2979324 RepID=UPI0021C75332|nr:2Fe-2S iron-sulfur cluster-binding protein [Paenarthrobacter sp. JL.01a]UXM93489.1 2Fe-2S iron-sulfur cluster-binding protein [Paenarthrobacter sp. JL.01a]